MSVLTVCVTCNDGEGQRLLEAVENEALARDLPLAIRGQACLAACKQSCTAALQGLGKHSYVFGQLAPDTVSVDALLDVAHHLTPSVAGTPAKGPAGKHGVIRQTRRGRPWGRSRPCRTAADQNAYETPTCTMGLSCRSRTRSTADG